MADIELVVKIPEEIRQAIIANIPLSFEQKRTLGRYVNHAILNGTPLPKGHGDLKDTEKLKNAFIAWSMAVQGNFTDADIASIICNSPTIIPADKEERK